MDSRPSGKERARHPTVESWLVRTDLREFKELNLALELRNTRRKKQHRGKMKGTLWTTKDGYGEFGDLGRILTQETLLWLQASTERLEVGARVSNGPEPQK